MGTMITLDVGGMAVDWSKNYRGTDHGALFQAGDRTRVRSEQIDYDYYKSDDPEIVEMEMAFVRRLANIVPRLELMGFGLDTIEAAYNRAAAASHETRAAIDGVNLERVVEPMSFSEFRDFVKAHPIDDLDDTFVSGFNAESRQQSMGRFAADIATERIPHYPPQGGGYSERSHFGDLLGFLHPYAVLRLLADNPANHDARVVWQFGPLVSAGWADAAEFEPGARRIQTFLIATEGSSDTVILKHALSLLRPGMADFFSFVDMRDGYPFTGTGNLRNFATGLAGIDVHNQVLFLLDNDAEGVDACTRIECLRLPANMRATCLPNLAELRAIPCLGPNGRQACDINGRGAAIECYLDLSAPGQPPAEVRWTNFKRPPDVYQGALQAKESYTRVFLKKTEASLTDGTYDTTKISSVLDHIFSVCTGIAARTNPWYQSPGSPYRP